ncbi:MAG: glycine cleavage system aminomethyltransferase GcvT [Candidatus Coatesbacteria bacterium]
MDATTINLRHTPLAEWHRAHGAKLVGFAGWEMPVMYSGIVEEHMAVRERAGLFDVSHMGRLDVRGAGAEAFLQRVLTNDLARIAPGQGQYTLALNEAGGVLDDLIVFRRADGYLVVMNAGNREKIMGHFRAHADGASVELVDRSADLAMIALQGLKAPALLAALTPATAALPRSAMAEFAIAGETMLVSRTGYTGEDGFELYPPSARAVAVWDALLAAGKGLPAVSCGLGARDGLRLEAGYSLYGHEIDEETSPWEAGLGWAVRPEKGNFIGREALLELKAKGPRKQQVAFTCAGPGIPRKDQALTDGNQEVGIVVSGTFSPCLKLGIGIGYVRGGGEVPAGLGVVVRGRALPVVRSKLPFYRSPGLAGGHP